MHKSKSKSKDPQDEAEKGILLEVISKPSSSNAASSSTRTVKNKTLVEEEDISSEFLFYAREYRIGDLIELLEDESITINLEKTEEDVNYTALHYITFSSKDFIHNNGKCDSREICAEKLLNYKNGKFKKFLIEKQDKYGNTPLHYACEFKIFELIDLFLKNGADPLIKRKADDRTPLSLLADGSSPTAIEKMRLMIEHCNMPIEDKKKLYATSLNHSNSINMLKFWIEEMNMDPNEIFEGESALHLTCEAGNTDEHAECIQYILSKMKDVKAQINKAFGSWELIPLHLAALTSNWRVLQVLIGNRYIDLKITVREGNVLHFIVIGYLDGAAASQCLQLVIQRTRYWLPEEKEDFYFKTKNSDGESAFDLACRLGAINLVTQFIKMDSTDLADTFITKERLSTIYRLCPSALERNLNGSIAFECFRQNHIRLNTRYIVGKESSKSILSTDTKCLYEVLKANPEDRDKTLNHVVIKCYLDIKWNRTCYFAVSWTILQVLLMVCYTILLLDIQKVNEHNSTKIESQELSEGASASNNKLSYISIPILVATFVLSFLMLTKEILQAVNDFIAYITSPLNCGQLLFLIAFIISIVSGFWNNEEALFCQTVFGAFGAFIGWVLLIRDIGKLPQCERYAEILAKVCKSSIKMVLFYSGCLIGALVAFRLLMKNNDGFHLPFGFAKIFAMMVGDLAYDDLFDEKKNIYYEEIAKLLVICFTFLASIVLFNLLVALAVSDINELEKSAERTRRVGQLQFVYALEKLFVAFQKCKCLQNVYSSFCVDNDKGEKIEISTLPDETQAELRAMKEKLFLEANYKDDNCTCTCKFG